MDAGLGYDVTKVSQPILVAQLSALDGVIAALDRQAEVIHALSDAQNRAHAREIIQRVLQVDPVTARRVLDLRWEDLNAEARGAFRRERDIVAAEMRSRNSLEPS